MVIFVAGQKQQIIGSSNVGIRFYSRFTWVAPLNRPILIIGEEERARELIAERLHYLSMRWQQPYLQVNCAAMPGKICWNRNCSAMKPAHLPVQHVAGLAYSREQTAAPCF